MEFSFFPFSNSLNMKRTELSLSLNSLKTSNSDGFARRVKLYNKHVLSSSSLIKIKRYWSAMIGKNGKRGKPLYGSRSLLNVTLSLHHCDYLGWVISLMVIIPLVYHTIHHFVLGQCYQFTSVLPICSREVIQFKTSSFTIQ